ncbi:MAG: HNH endonuclease [Rhodobacterales bacterium]|nr:HNH endonuclease [Rhodobacterales bacterium]
MLDTSVFKKLAHNDTGKAPGHQGGIYIPKGIAPFFPPLPAVTASDGPTVDSILTADLFVDGQRVGTVQTRYQHQTWGGTRTPERRLTDNLGPLRNLASAGDILLFTKDLDDDGYIQLHLVRQGTAEYRVLESSIGPAKSGPLDPANPPVSVSQIAEAERYVEEEASEPPFAFDEDRATTETTTVRKARDRAFRSKLLEQYDHRCAFTGRKFISPVGNMIVGLDAAHVIPVSEKGSDHPANGIPLTKDLHWSFDRGLIGVAADRTILVPVSVASLPGNEFLRNLHGQPIREAMDISLRVMPEALDWHRQNRLVG